MQEDLLKVRRENEDRSQECRATKRLLNELQLSSIEELTSEVRVCSEHPSP